MGPIGDMLFGSEPGVTTKKLDTLLPEQEEALLELIQVLLSDMGLVGAEGVELTDLENVALDVIGQQIGDIGAGDFGVLDEAEGFISDLFKLSTDKDLLSSFFQSNVVGPLEEVLGDQFSEIGGRFAGQFFGGERREAEGRAREDFFDASVAGANEFALALQGLAASGVSAVPKLAEARTSSLLGLTQGAGLKRRASEDEMARIIDDLLASIGIQGIENIVIGDAGSSGLLGDIGLGFNIGG